MAHFAQLDINNRVINVVVVNNDVLDNKEFPESEQLGVAFLRSIYPNTHWKQTSYSGSFRKRFAVLGQQYIPKYDAFIPHKYYRSWKFNEVTCDWDPPVQYPNDGELYFWDEDVLEWKKE